MPDSPQSHPVLKSNASPELIQAVQEIELASDQCYADLALLNLPGNLAIWSLLTYLIREHTEVELNGHGPGSHDFTGLIINASRAISTAINWVSKHGRPPSRLVRLASTGATQESSRAAFAVAHNYNAFQSCLPMWHRDRYAAQVLTPAHAVFTVPGGSRQRQVSAYQKGYRPLSGDHAIIPAEPVAQSPLRVALFEEVLDAATSRKPRSFTYREPRKLWENLLPDYVLRVGEATRRSPALELGGYTLSEFNQFFAALTTMAAAHEFLCFAWGRRRGSYPQDSAVMVRLRQDWVKSLGGLSGLSNSKTTAILDDLTYGFGNSVDMILQPFIPLGNSSPWLAVAPPFPLKSRPDENILRIVSQSRNSAFSETSNSKEGELRAQVKSRCAQFLPEGPRLLPKPLPDIDLLLIDEPTSTIVFCEAKWIRKTLRVAEHIDRDRDVSKGFEQLEKIQTFLHAHPCHLESLGTIPKPLDQYRNVHYIVLARDHWLWQDPSNNIAIIEFEPFIRVISAASDLHTAIEELLRYEWLPVEGRDFEVQSESARVAGVTIQSEVFYSLPRRHMRL